MERDLQYFSARVCCVCFGLCGQGVSVAAVPVSLSVVVSVSVPLTASVPASGFGVRGLRARLCPRRAPVPVSVLLPALVPSGLLS